MIRTVRPKGNYYNLFDNIKVSLPFIRKWYSKDNSEDQLDKVIKKGYQIISWRDKVELSILGPRFQSNFKASSVKKNIDEFFRLKCNKFWVTFYLVIYVSKNVL